jgi:aldehyde:ferredoxin oxidoreductase
MNNELYGMNGKILYIDLSNGKIWTEKYTREILQKYIGSRGIMARLYWDLISPNIDPLDSENKYMIGAGTFSGLPVPSAGRTTVTFKSPLTGRYFKGSVGGDFATKLKQNGYDIIIISGKSEIPVYIYINNDYIDILSAKEIWGLNIRDSFLKLSKRHGQNIESCLIGPAGEKLIKFASVNFSIYNVAARGGGGTLLGSKKLKGIVLGEGIYPLTVKNPIEFKKLIKDIRNKIMSDEALFSTGKYGTSGSLSWLDNLSVFPPYNFQKSYWDDSRKISGEEIINKGYLINRAGCGQCIVSCHRVTQTKKYEGIITIGPELETLGAFGNNLGISDLDSLILINDIVEINGFDSISLGILIGWIIESYEKGYLSELKTKYNIEPKWGDLKSILDLINFILLRKEGLSYLLGEGTYSACNKINPETCKWALQANGLEQSHVDTRIAKAYALAFALNPRGPDHLHTETFAEFGASKGAIELIERITGHKEYAGINKIEGRPEIVIWHEDIYALTDSVGLCAFTTTAGYAIDENTLSKLFTTVTGIDKTSQTIMKDGERIVTLERMIIGREGRTRKQDTLPYRMMHEKSLTRNGNEVITTPDELNNLLDEYFKLRGWDIQTGLPTNNKIKDLNLEDLKEVN